CCGREILLRAYRRALRNPRYRTRRRWGFRLCRPRNRAPTARIRRAGAEPRVAQDAGSRLRLRKLEDWLAGWGDANCVMPGARIRVGTAPVKSVSIVPSLEYGVNREPV